MKRRYRLKERARRQAETRQRIVEAAVELHTSVGPARTIISAIAERAGVQRHTVYAHFPDERALFSSCTAHWATLHAVPEPSRWTAIEDPRRRLEAALEDVYAWYEQVELDLVLFDRDALVHEITAEYVTRRQERFRTLRELVSAGWPRRKAVRAAIGHALDFETWRSLVRRQGLSRRQAIDAMLRLVASV